MSKIDHLNKLLFLFENDERKIHQRCIISRKKIDDEFAKCDLLKNCLAEYRKTLLNTNQTVNAVTYQQYHQFFSQLEKAIKQQSDILMRLNENHHKLLKEYEIIKNKIKKLQKIISKETYLIEYQYN